MEKTALFESITDYIDSQNLVPENSTIVVGLSGGPDSIFLLHLLNQLRKTKKITVTAAHLDHEWRPESGSDAAFCATIAAQLDIPFVQEKLSSLTMSLPWRGSQEDIGRKARRFFLESIAKKQNAHAIALAHHENDQQETFFIRLLRGATLTGLTGMRPKYGNYIRPLLATDKKTLLTYLQKNNINYLIDPSNESPTYLRNRIRATIIPALQACDARFDQNFAATINRLQETEEFLESITQETLQKISVLGKKTDLDPDRIQSFEIKIPALLALHPALRYRVILAWLCAHHLPFEPAQSFFDEIIRFLRSPHGGSHTLNPTWQLVKRKKHARLERKAQQN